MAYHVRLYRNLLLIRELKMKRIVLLLLSLLLAGCVTKVAPTVKNINTLVPGLVQTKKTGEPMLERGMIKSIKGFMARTNYYPPDMEGMAFPLIRKGVVWQCPTMLDDGDFLCVNDEYYQNETLTPTGKESLSELPLFVLKSLGEFRGLYFARTGLVVEEKDKMKGVFIPIDVPLNETYKHELIYEGRVEDNIKITYLEFAEDFTRPVFYQGLSFNIASLNIVSIKDILIEVIDANETEIKFIVKN